MTQISIIAALDRGLAIGYDNQLPWSLPDDLRRFKRLTMGYMILMGRKTADSIGRALPGRRNLVLTRSASSPIAGMDAVSSIEQALALTDGELFVIGGGEVYTQTLPRAQRMYLTHVDTSLAAADAWFPEYELLSWHVDASESHPADARHAFAFDFVDYRRREQP